MDTPTSFPLGDASHSFELTPLWINAFGSKDAQRSPKSSAFFREALLRLRRKAALMVSQIRKDLPELTVHDISHLDALWEIGSLIAGPELPLNPAEGYVFGAAVLLHDAAMTLAAYPRGLADLIETDEWLDTVCSLGFTDPGSGMDEPSRYSEATVKVAVPLVLRALHARHAEALPMAPWHSEAGTEYLIDDPDLREFYGGIIGRIAKSHNESAGSLAVSMGNPIGAIVEAPPEWVVDPLKIACLLRTADAAHIDQRRAPRFLQSLLKPEKVSALHWTFQRKLAKPRAEGDALVYSSGPDFTLPDADAWWLCFDTVRMIDRELNEVDMILENHGKTRFAARRVLGIDSATAFSAFVRTRGWDPIDARIKVSDVPRLVGLLGGAHLYGDDDLVPIRELLQNAADATLARKLMEPAANLRGTVKVRILQDESSYWLEVLDNGIGMSERTLTEHLLDFGRSFWTTEAVKQEFPGLLAKGLSPTGRFGIGFFSVFMLGDIVRVSSRRFDAALDATKTLEFRNGLELRPILRQATREELVHDGGTRVSVRLKRSPYVKGGFLAVAESKKDVEIRDFGQVIAALCPSIEVRIQAGEQESEELIIDSGDWQRISGADLLRRVASFKTSDSLGLQAHAPLVRSLSDKKGVYGRACVNCSHYGWNKLAGAITVGGFRAAELSGIAGVLIGSTEVVTRDKAVPAVPIAALTKWAEDQANLVHAGAFSDSEKIWGAAVLMRCGAHPGELPIGSKDDEFLNAKQVIGLLSSLDRIQVHDGLDVEYDGSRDDCHPKKFENNFSASPNVLFLERASPNLLAGSGKRGWPDGLFSTEDGQPPFSFEVVLLACIREAWGEKYSAYDSECTVGEVEGEKICRDVKEYARNQS